MRVQTLSEARWILGFFAVLAAASWFVSGWLSLLFLLLFFCTVAFFRDPERTAPADPNLIVAAADGTVMDIIESDENQVLKAKTRRIGIFLSIFDVHTNRAPIDGSVIYRDMGFRESTRHDCRASDHGSYCQTHRGLVANRGRIKKR